jgi:FHIPEP family
MDHASPARLEIVLDTAVHRCVLPWLADLERDTTRRVAEVLDRLGVASAPSATVHPASDGYAVGVLLDGAALPFPPSFLARHWYASAEGDLPDSTIDYMPTAQREVHTWLIRAARVVGEREAEPIGKALLAMIPRLTADVISLHPGALLRGDDVADWFRDDDPRRDDAIGILRQLLELGVSLNDRERVVLVVRGALSLGGPADDAFEECFAALRSRSVEVHLDARSFDALVPGGERSPDVTIGAIDPAVRDAMEIVRRHRLRKLGADVPVAFVRSRLRRQCEMRIRINDRLTPPVPLPTPDEIGVSASPRTLERAGITGRRLADPVTGTHLTAVPAGHADSVARAGFVPVAPAAYMVGAFARGVTPLAYRVIAVDGVERALAQFEPESAVLVHAVLARFGLGSLTRLLRALVREAAPVDDLWRLLNALLRFCDVEKPDEDPDRTLAYVRRELCDRIAVEACGLEAIGTGSAPVHETLGPFEREVERWSETPPSDDDLRRARAAVWRSVGNIAGDVQPVVLTSPAARLPLRLALDHELPDAQVLARTEIIRGIELHRVGTIGE